MAQFRIDTQSFLPQEKTIFESNILSTPDGRVVSFSNPLPVSLGSNNINIVGNVSIPTMVTVNSTPSNPVHTHISEIGTSDLLNVPYMPIDGNVKVNNLVTIAGTVAVNNFPTTFNVSVNSSTSSITAKQPDASTTAFDEPLAIGITPVIQVDGIYGLNPDTWTSTKLNGGNITTSNSTFIIDSGTSPGGYARLATLKYMTYQPGQGSMFRWTAAFTADNTNKNANGVDNIVQTTGPIDREDGYAIGYSGSTSSSSAKKIGFLHRMNGKAEIQTLTVTTAPTGSQTANVTLNGVSFNVGLTTSTSTQYTAQQIAMNLKSNAVASQQWDVDACGNTVTFIYYSPGPKNGTYSFSSSGTGTLAAASFSRLIGGVAPNDTWTYVDSWDNQNVSFDPTKLNVFGLDFRWLGSGIVRLFMEDPATGKMTLMHTQKWASSNTIPHLIKPSLRLVYRAGTTAGATPSQNTIVRGSSAFGGIQGAITQTSSSQSFFNLDGSTRAKDSLWHLLSIQNPSVRNNSVNKTALLVQSVSVSCKSTDPSVIYIIKNCVGASDLLLYNALPNATSFNFAQYSISSVTENLTQDTIAQVATVGINGNINLDLRDYNITLAPAETISVFISSTSSINGTSIGMSWKID